MLDQLTLPGFAQRARRSIPLILLTAALCAVGSRGAAAQTDEAAAEEAATASPWKVVRLKEPAGGRAEGTKMLRSGDLNNQKLFDAYWTYYISQITWGQHDLADIRTRIKSVLRGSRDPARERLAKQIILPFCSKVAKDPGFSPHARVNAVLMIGELNQVEPVPGGPPQVSLPEARPVLLELLDPKLPVDDVHDALRVEAMVGLMNHIERGGIKDDKQRKQVDSLLQGILNAKEPPQGRRPEIHKWIQRVAGEVRTSLNGGEVVRGG